MTAAEFHRPFAADRISPGGSAQEVTATAAECAALALRLAIPAVLSLGCRFHLRRMEGGRIAASGELRARLVRDCVVTLEPFEAAIAESFRIVFVPAEAIEERLDLEADDEVPYEAGAIDLGEAAVEQVALTLDPYPRRPGAALPEAAAEEAPSPFAVLARRDRG